MKLATASGRVTWSSRKFLPQLRNDIGLITKNPEHDWIAAEVAYARGKGKHIIVIVEQGENFNPTLLGRDFEQIRFSGDRIEESFVKLLREFRNIGMRIA